MAKTISDEQMKLSIIINGNEAQKELLDLEKSTRKLTEENKALGLQKKLLIKQGKEESAEYKTLTATMKANTAEITSNKNKMVELQNQIGLTGLTMHQLTQKAQLLRMSLLNAIPGGEAHKKYTAELGLVTARMDELKGKSAAAKMSLGSLADSFNRYQAITLGVVAALTGVVLSIQKIIDINGKLSDAQADVMKTTSMTKAEVDELTKSFGLLETRTSRIDLLKIAEQGGRLGIMKEDIGDFVKTMNMAAVSLGDSFTGGVDQVAEQLGKIKFLFKETKDMNVEEAYNSIGSAINDLGANGTANEANIAEFTKRIGSLTDVLKPSVQETLALGTAFEESGIEAEQSSRAYNIFMKQASTSADKFGKVMNLSTKAVEDMINTNPLNFMLEFSKGLNGMNATEVAKTLDYLGVNADGANKVIGAMGNNFDRFHQLIDLSNNSFSTGTSLINEYNIKNNNLAATLEKISKRVSGWFSSETFIKWLSTAVDWIAKFVGATDDADGSVTAWKNSLVFIAKMIAIVTAAMITNVGWQQLVVLWTNRNTEANILYTTGAKARAFADGVAMVASQAYAAVTMLMTGNIAGATQAFRVLTATMMTTPWGFIIGAIAAIGTAYVMFSEDAKEADTAQSMLNKTIKDSDAIVNQQTASMKTLLAVAKDETASKEARLAAIKKLNEISPEYLNTLTLENVKTAEGTKLIDAYVKSLEKKAMLEVLQKRQKAIMEDMDKKKNMSLDEEIHWYDEAWAMVKNLGNAELAGADVAITASQRKQKGLADLQNQLKLTNAEMEAFLKKNPSVIVDIETGTTPKGSNYTVGGGAGAGTGTGNKKNPNSTLAEINKLKLDEQLKFNEQTLKLSRQLEDDKIAAMQDGYDKEVLIENNRYQREVEDLNRQKVHTDELAKLDEDIAKAKESKDLTKYNALLTIRKGWDAKNLALDAQIDAIKEGKLNIHNNKVAIIKEKAAKDLLDKEQETFNQEKQARETAFYNELAGMDLTDSEKAARIKAFNESEIEIQKTFLVKKIAELNSIMAGNIIEGIDFSLMSPEAKKKLGEDLALVMNALAKINNANPNKAGKELDLGLGGEGKDILGFSQQQWDNFATNIEKGTIGIQTLQMAYQLASQVVGQLDQYMTASENATVKKTETITNQKKKKLDKQLKDGIISKTQYDKKVAKLDEELENKKFEIELKQAKRKKAMSIVDTVVNTAVAIMQAYSQLGPIGGTIAAALIGIMGGLQIATIMKQPLPTRGYEQGLYGDYVTREQDGKKFKSSYAGKTRSGLVSNTSHFLVAENGPEMVIDNKAWRQMNPEVKDSLIRELRGIRGFEQGLYNQEKMRIEVPATSTPTTGGNDQMMTLMMTLVAENTAVLKDLRDKGTIAVMTNRDLKSMGYLKDGITAYDELRTKSKR
jgi:tubulin-specific chaperone A